MKKRPKTYTGTVDHISKQYAYITVKELPQDILVFHHNLKGAWHHDTVKVAILHGKKRSSKPEGKVIEIVERAYKKVIGQIKKEGQHHILLPDHKRLHHPILLPATHPNNQPSQKAIAQITSWPSPPALATGTITQLLGEVGTHRAETEAIIQQFGFSSSFAPHLIQAANQFPERLSQEEIKRRRDFRHVPTLTIDPDNSQDFDDALSFQELPDGNYEVGIHIADVSHYVRTNSPIDQEALERGTSVYLVGETIPMLPERLSNNLCSLKPHEDRPAFSLVATIDANARVQDNWVGETIIHSNQRFTYAQAKEAIDNQKGYLHRELSILNELAKKLRTRRMKHGAIPFNTTDFNIHLDEAGEPIHITAKQNTIAHQLIEEFMLLANRLIAQKVYKMKSKKQQHLPFIYRIHDEPDPEKIENLTRFASLLGYSFKPKKGQLPKAYQALLTEIEGTPYQHTIQSLAIRTMAQACYTTEPKPHFGLAFAHYTHFTSPIRRYPDLIVHRLLKRYLRGERSIEESYQEVAQHTSQRERLAVEAERASINYKQVVFMQKLEGQTLQGIISHITPWGVFIEIIENKCEGMVRLSDIQNDYYTFEPEKFRIKGSKTGHTYKLGEVVKVKVKKCDLEKRTVDLVFV
ncbi:MAG: ribonuclease R [Bacteroidota bacterium]